jgi:hypothetical protein
MKHDERMAFLAEIITLIKKLKHSDLDIATVIGRFGLDNSSKYVQALRSGLEVGRVEDGVVVRDEDLDPVFKLLLDLFSRVYKRAYALNAHNDSKRFWYWDFSMPSAAFKIFELDLKGNIDISEFEFK